uniref:WD repeat-containing protein 6 n=1 Tax=Davidia involucrata TaxID=16924 RepID=A0A5B7C8Q1_DAVIN
MEVVRSHSVGPVLFGHNARVWDCCIFDTLIITAGEDCTCRVWGLDGNQIKMIKEHGGRGIWRCLYDPNSLLLVTAGFDSAIKAHQLHASLSQGSDTHAEEVKEFTDRTEIVTVRIPSSSQHIGLMDSKSEYVRCLHFMHEDTLYVATNNGYLYHAKLSDNGDVKWTKLLQVSGKAPIVCMDLLSRSSSDLPSNIEDWVAVGDGKGCMTIVSVVGDICTPKVGFSLTWSAGLERQLLGTYWCKSLGYRFIFTADPRGTLKLWKLCDPLQSVSHSRMKSYMSLVAEFASCFGIRIMCLDVSFEEEVLVCGDLRGNLVLFPLLKDLLLDIPVASEVKLSPSNYFKGAHGISSVCSISIARFSSRQIEIHSTGGDGCICYLEYDRDRQNLEFIGLKQVKELSSVQSVSNANSHDDLASGLYAIGFASANFIIWNVITETKVFQVPCGGWRRPHSYYLGDVPELKSCFAFVKDEIIYIHRCWVRDSENKIYPQNLHLQFHGREMHSLCFISGDSQFYSNEKQGLFSRSSFIATGCEDGTVRLTRYDPVVESWSASKLLGEHVGGSAVRSICCVSKIHTIAADLTGMPNGINIQNVALDDRENPFLLISVGAKQVLTSWKRKNRMRDIKEEALADGLDNRTGYGFKPSSGIISSMSFQWLSTDMPIKYCSTHEMRENNEDEVGAAENVSGINSDAPSESPFPENRKMESKSCLRVKYENDWRYLAVTAFLVKVAYSRLTVCFVVVACSDATLALRALVLPYRLWFDVALLVPLSSPVLALQHVIIPVCLPSEDNIQSGNVYLIISGSTDGSITFWDLTESIETFTLRMSALQVEKSIDFQKRPRTGRGSQGGRWWRTLSSSVSKKKPGDGSVTAKTIEGTSENMLNNDACVTSSKLTDSERSAIACSSLGSEVNAYDSSSKICTIWPLHVLNNIHESGVNCLHVSDIKNSRHSDFGFLYYVLSGGDDQALHCLGFDLALLPLSKYSENKNPDIIHDITESVTVKSITHCCHNQKYRIRFLYHDKIASAHSSAVKGIWTDGSWVFSVGLDQRIRCWHLQEHGKLNEHAHLIVSVPEPEALDARCCGRNYYQIAVAGRGMQMVEFSASCGVDCGD